MNATLSNPPRQRKPRPKPARSIRLDIPPEGTKSPGVVSITVGTERVSYFLNVLATDFGRGFRLVKLGIDASGEYAANVDGEKRSCECKGFLRHHHCKHADGIAALIAAGKL
jgi:hypothetical protein